MLLAAALKQDFGLTVKVHNLIEMITENMVTDCDQYKGFYAGTCPDDQSCNGLLPSQKLLN